MQQAHRALLIGVGNVPSAPGLTEPLDTVVATDLQLMDTALQGAGYEVETLLDAVKSKISTRLYEVAREVPVGGTLLVYFTGHGVRVGTEDFLVPADVTPPSDGNWQGPYVDSLLSAKISPLLKECKADTVLWLIDACRTDMTAGGDPFGNSSDNGPPGSGFAVMMGCSAGERSGYTSEGSFFTRSLADALGPMTPARTVQQVFDMARAKTHEGARRLRGLTQTPTIRYGTNSEEETRGREICTGRELLESWRDAVHKTPLWQRVVASDQRSVSRFQGSLDALVEQCARTLYLAQDRLPAPDPWNDDAFPVRLLQDRLPQLMPESATLSAIEAAALVAAPFLHEAAWANRLSQAVEATPYDLERRSDGGAHRRHYEQIVDQHARVARKVTECRARDRDQDVTAVTMWLVHRWIAERFETDDAAVPSEPAHTLAKSLLGARDAVADDRVHELADLLRATAAAIGGEEPPDGEETHALSKVLLPDGHQCFRIRPLTRLLRLAATLAVDVRSFPDVVAEHLAVTDPVLPQEVIGIARRLSWARDGDALHLDAPCPHQALHAALTEIAEQGHQHAEQIAGLAKSLPEPEAALLVGVPTKVTARDVRPRRTSRGPSYEIPLLRFHLAQTEVRELLMGEQLYGGEPQLALRELYQNAMDACRYRAMRWSYLRNTGSDPDNWSGQIVITQGQDERGHYVECRDNGVGMSAEQLKYTFTRAGSRFEQSKAFRREQSRWLRHDSALRLYPNSRFGIGVFSYFMLADEMTIVTRQVSTEGIPAKHALQVDIPSSGSLFRIQRHDGSGDGMARGGTRVRLYLRSNVVAEGLSCVNALRKLIRVSEFSLEVSDSAGVPHMWTPDVLQPAPDSTDGEPLEAVRDVLWWVPGEGAVLCDGIMTDQKPFGFVLNLTGPHAGRLSVSRKELQDFDADWAEENWRKGAAALVDWPQLTMEWLWQLDRRNRPVAEVLHDEWRGRGIAVRRGMQESHALDIEGWFHLDNAYISSAQSKRSNVERPQLAPWRYAALGMRHGSFASSAPLSLEGYPVPGPGDASLPTDTQQMWWKVVRHAADHGQTVRDVVRRQRRLRIAHTSEGPPPVTGEDPSWVPDEFDRAITRRLDTAENLGWVADASRHPDELGNLVLASQQLGMPLGEVIGRCARYAPLRVAPFPDVPTHHENYVCTARDIAHLLISQPFTPSVRRVSGPEDVRAVSESTHAPVSEILDTLTRFEWLGWTTPAAAEVDAWIKLDEDAFAVLKSFTWVGPDGRRVLPWAATFAMAERLGADLGEAEEELARIATSMDMVHERRYTHGSQGRHLVPSARAVELVGELAEYDCPLEDGVRLNELAYAAHVTEKDAELPGAVNELQTAGVSLPENIDIIFAWADLPLRSRYVLSGKDLSYSSEDCPAEYLTTAALFQSAEFLHEALQEVWEIARRDADRFGLAVPPLPHEFAQYRPTHRECLALTYQTLDANGEYLPYAWKSLTPAALAAYAKDSEIDTRTAYERLAALRPLGALVPDLPREALDALPRAVPSGHDLVALSSEHRLTDEEEPPSPLDLVSLAGRLGEPLPETVRRIEPYLPLWPTASVLPPTPNTIPLWQDLILLTEHLDGRLPAVEGLMSPRHVTLAADATGECEAWIRSRLRLYATMFDLHLDKDHD